MDMAMPGSIGFDAIERIRADVAEALRRGARGYLLKSLEPHTLAGHVREAVRGEVPMSPEVTRTMAPGIGQGVSPTAGTHDSEIARRLALAENTVKDYLKHILTIFRVENRAQAVARAFRIGVLVR